MTLITLANPLLQWVDPLQYLSTTQPLAHSLHSGSIGEKIEKAEARRFMV